MKELLSAKNIRQFFSYFGVGGVSALVEWGVFSILEYLFSVPYLLATILAFIVSTTTNWYLGRRFTFRDSKYQKKKTKEVLLIFLVSGIGLLFNLLLMYFFVDVVGMNTNIMKTLAKILATGIVFVWNFLSRKLWIYADEKSVD